MKEARNIINNFISLIFSLIHKINNAIHSFFSVFKKVFQYLDFKIKRLFLVADRSLSCLVIFLTKLSIIVAVLFFVLYCVEELNKNVSIAIQPFPKEFTESEKGYTEEILCLELKNMIQNIENLNKLKTIILSNQISSIRKTLLVMGQDYGNTTNKYYIPSANRMPINISIQSINFPINHHGLTPMV